MTGGNMSNKDYTQQILPGEGENDYVRYMRTDTLLSLQRRPEEMVHRDELLFQTVHQSTELWLKHACFEVTTATEHINKNEPAAAVRLLERAILGINLLTQQLDMLRLLAPWDFQKLRSVLGHGSGFDSPGWRDVRKVSPTLGEAFYALLEQRRTTLLDIYRGSLDNDLYRLAETLMSWDEAIAVWRTKHYKIAIRANGHGAVTTQGRSVDFLAKLISHKFYPPLWEIRTDLTRLGPMGNLTEREDAEPEA